MGQRGREVEEGRWRKGGRGREVEEGRWRKGGRGIFKRLFLS